LVHLTCLSTLFYFSACMSKIFSQLRLETAGKTDKRIATMKEIVAGIRVIKMHTWEKPFASLIDLYRRYYTKNALNSTNNKLLDCCHVIQLIRMEVDVIRRTSIYRALNTSLNFISFKLIVFITFVVYVLNGNTLTAEKVKEYITIEFVLKNV